MVRACSRAPASSTCRNAFTCGSRARSAWRKALVTASEVTSPRVRAARRSAAVRSIMGVPQCLAAALGAALWSAAPRAAAKRELFEDGRDAVEVALPVGGVGEGVGDGQRRPRLGGP